MGQDTGFFASIPRLEEHQSVLRREMALADELCRQLQLLSGQEGFVADDRYRQLVKQANRLRKFLNELYQTMGYAAEALTDASMAAGGALQRAADGARKPIRIDLH